MLILNHHLASQFHFPGGETPSGDQANAKTFNRVEGKVDINTPDTNRPDDYSKKENRDTLLYSEAPKAIAELRAVNKNLEADRLQRSIDLARQNESDPVANKEAVAKNVRNQVDRALSDPMVKAAERLKLYQVDGQRAISLLRSQGKETEANNLGKTIQMALESETSQTPFVNRLQAARAVKNIVDRTLASEGAGTLVYGADTITTPADKTAQAPSNKPGEMVAVSNADVPPSVRRQVMAKVDDSTPVGTRVEIRVNNVRWVATKVNNRRYDYSKQSV
jgi:hypothetical protein